jgi:hypothetical protein
MNNATTATRLQAAVWHHPLASKRGLLERLFTFWFNSFVYNQIWEDPRVDLAALELVPGESAAWENLRPGGRLLAVDFWDAAGVPFGFGRVLRAWLSRFHTYPRPEIIPFIAELPGGEPMRIETVGPRYAFLISRRKL